MADDSSIPRFPNGRNKLDSTGEFFTVGAPLHAVRAGYIQRRADDELYAAVINGRYAHVLVPDRSGKSSLIAATAARLEAKGVKVAILDLQQFGVRDGGSDPGRWYYNVAYRLLRQLRIRYDLQTWWHDRSILSNRQRLLEFYADIVLQSVAERTVIFIDAIQCIENLPFADQLLASIRAAHNARTMDPDFSRLVFVLLGECDPVSLVAEPELSPFNVTQPIELDDFTREQLDMFTTELNLDHDAAAAALDRIYYWTHGQPYLSQKLARQVARDRIEGDIAGHVDRIALTQLAGRAALHSEPQMSHIHRVVVNDDKKEALLNLYGRIRKGIDVPADLGSALQRRLMSVGLIAIDHDGKLRVRNRLYKAVFTARWANENLPTRLRVPAMVAGVLLLFVLLPFAYTQWLPRPYMKVLASPATTLETALAAYQNLHSFPGHADAADNLFRQFVEQRALLAVSLGEINQVADLARQLPDAGRLPETLLGDFWDRRAGKALHGERRDEALIATLESLVMATPYRRQRAASLIDDDYPLLIASLPPLPGRTIVFDPVAMLLTAAAGGQVSQWSLVARELQRHPDWTVTALEVVPLVRRVVIDRPGRVKRIGLMLNISHARLADLRIKIIAPSGRAAEIETGIERSFSNDDIRIPASQMQDLVGESLAGTWSISVRDEIPGVAGQLVGWNLKLNSQGAIEDFQRGLNIADPVERETDEVWFDPGGRYAIARASQSDSARIWDLVHGEPLRAIAVSEHERLIGLDADASRLVTATQDGINLWDTTSGDRIAALAIGAASTGAVMTGDGRHLFVEHRGDIDTKLDVWSLDRRSVSAEVEVAGAPALVAVDPTGTRVAVADFDRAVRVWSLTDGQLLAQIDLAVRPSAISLASGGHTLGVVHGQAGVSLWAVSRPQNPLLEESGDGHWRLEFSPSGSSVLAGRAEAGFQVYRSADGQLIGPPVGFRNDPGPGTMLAFSADEQVIFTGNPRGVSRFWRAAEPPPAAADGHPPHDHALWQPSADRVSLALPENGGIVIGDAAGDVHMLPAGAGLDEVRAASEDVSFVGHNARVSLLRADRAGRVVASAASDNSVRVWDAASGQPYPWIAELDGDTISDMAFAWDATSLAVLHGSILVMLDTADGRIMAEFELGQARHALAFGTDNRVYTGGESGLLRVVARADDGSWAMQPLWRGAHKITQLAVSPHGEYLVLVDDRNIASQFMLAEGRIGARTVAFPGPVEEIAFGHSGVRAYIRTARWTHRVSLSANGLYWVDSILSPKPLNGARIVFGADGSATAHRPFLPTARNGFVELVELGFPGSTNPALFGTRQELLAAWRERLAYGTALAVTD